ncbi:hypothetical protein SeLEV6574_g04842 [Synchytrium endobioticum]|uniref:ADF-H domain-containing protein n=1 Tax=Synchytrium endobioticum TaxID=286115 RepID=A0A507CY59_9FUNG|nr:hypothetical protein SeLEV6574_g04842 [Synchytrium endobioticum]
MSTQLGLGRYADQIRLAYNKVKDPSSDTNWVIYSYDKDNELKPIETGQNGLQELVDEFNSSKIQYAFARVIEPISGLPKILLISWCGEGVPVYRKGLFNSHVSDFQRFFTGYHVAINARNEQDVTVSTIMKKVMDSSGAKYSIHQTELSHDNIQPASKTSPYPSFSKPAPFAGASLSKPSASTNKTSAASSISSGQAAAPAPAPRPTPSAPTPQPMPSNFPASSHPLTKQDKHPDPIFDGLTDGNRKTIAERERRMKEDADLRDREARSQAEREAREADEHAEDAKAASIAKQKAHDSAKFPQQTTLPPPPAVVQLPPRPARSDPRPPSPPAPAPAPVQSQGTTATAIYAYTAEESNEISFDEGEIITNVHEIDANWWQGQNSKGDTGLFASNFVQKNEQGDDPTVPALASVLEPLSPAPRGIPGPPAAPAPPSPPPLHARQSVPASISAIALYDYDAVEENEVSFYAGDTIEHIVFVSQEWWQGFVHGQEDPWYPQVGLGVAILCLPHQKSSSDKWKSSQQETQCCVLVEKLTLFFAPNPIKVSILIPRGRVDKLFDYDFPQLSWETNANVVPSTRTEYPSSMLLFRTLNACGVRLIDELCAKSDGTGLRGLNELRIYQGLTTGHGIGSLPSKQPRIPRVLGFLGTLHQPLFRDCVQLVAHVELPEWRRTNSSPEDELAIKGKKERLAELIQLQDEFEILDGLRDTVSKLVEQFVWDEEAAIDQKREKFGLGHVKAASFSPLSTNSLGTRFITQERTRMSATARNKSHMLRTRSIIYQTHRQIILGAGRKQGASTKALKRHARRYMLIITYDEYMTFQRCFHFARSDVQEAVAEDPKLSGYARAQGKNGHVLMAKRIGANRLASVLEDAGCFEAHHCQSLHAVRYCETCSTAWVETNAVRNILYCFLYERAFVERPRPFQRGTNTESD